MKLMLLLGSGVSKPSGLPGVQKLTEAVLTGRWFRHTDGKFYPLERGRDHQHHVGKKMIPERLFPHRQNTAGIPEARPGCPGQLIRNCFISK
jgi:hypothetical protein